MEVKFSPLLEVCDLLPLTPERLQALPDIIDIRCGRVGIGLYFYPVSSWHCGWHIQKQLGSLNSCTPWFCRYCFELVMPTMLVEYAVF